MQPQMFHIFKLFFYQYKVTQRKTFIRIFQRFWSSIFCKPGAELFVQLITYHIIENGKRKRWPNSDEGFSDLMT